MGYALAKNAARRGAEVTLVTGPTSLEKPFFVNTIPVVTAEEMYQAVTDAFAEQDIVVMAAAVADYRPKTVADEKIKKPMVDWRWKWNARKIFWEPFLPGRKTSSCVDFPWRHSI